MEPFQDGCYIIGEALKVSFQTYKYPLQLAIAWHILAPWTGILPTLALGLAFLKTASYISPRCGADLSAMGAFDIPSINMSLLVLAVCYSVSVIAQSWQSLLIASKISSVTSASGVGLG